MEEKEKVCPNCREVKSRCEDNEYCHYPWAEPKPCVKPKLTGIQKEIRLQQEKSE